MPRPSRPNWSHSKFSDLSFQKVLNLHEFYETLFLVSSKHNLWYRHISLGGVFKVRFSWSCGILEQLWFLELLAKVKQQSYKAHLQHCFLGINSDELSGKNSSVQTAVAKVILLWIAVCTARFRGAKY